MGGVTKIEYFHHGNHERALHEGVDGSAACGCFVKLWPDGLLVRMVEQGVRRHEGMDWAAVHFAVELATDKEHRVPNEQ